VYIALLSAVTNSHSTVALAAVPAGARTENSNVSWPGGMSRVLGMVVKGAHRLSWMGVLHACERVMVLRAEGTP